MKKVFFYVAIATSVILTACHKNAGVPEPVQKVVGQLQASMTGDEEDGLIPQDVTIEGQNVVCVMKIDESEFDGMTFKQAFENAGFTEEILSQTLKESMLEDMDDELVEQIAVLREYKYNLEFRYVGSESEEVMNATISYEDLPEVE